MKKALMKNLLYLFFAFASFEISAQTTAEEYLNSAVSKFYLNDITDAIVDYTKAIEIDPNYVEAYRKRGLAKETLKDFSGAIVDYTKAVEINPHYAPA
ncbi:MAG: tetratricopeptide repeat protein, partial [Flavobacteriales bacterium]